MQFQDEPADPRDYLPPPQLRQWTATDFDGDELLITLYAGGDPQCLWEVGGLEVSRRIDSTRWGPPFEVEEITE